MPEFDRLKWNRKYAEAADAFSRPSAVFTALAEWLPPPGRALDVAGGAGRHAIWLAQRGWDVTIADVSDVGLGLATERARTAGVTVTTCRVDLEQEPLPPGPWDLVLTCHFLWRPLYASIAAALSPQGRLIIVQPTRSNLLRNEKPPEPYLLEDGELPERIVEARLRVLYYREGWSVEDRHEAVLVAGRE